MKATNQNVGDGRGAWGWLLQRLSATLLVILILAHLWIEHFLHPGRVITYHSVLVRLVHGLFQAIDYALLIVVVYHALNGVRNILLDRAWSHGMRIALTAGFFVLGLATVLLGADILSAFLTPRAWFYL